VRLFLAECPSYLSEIRRVVTNRDPKALEFAAHTLKGSIADLFTRQPFGAASKLVAMGERRQSGGVEEAHAALEKEITQLRLALATLGREHARSET